MQLPPTTDIEQALHDALPPSLHASIPVLAQVLAAARDGHPARVATPDLIKALEHLQGHTLNLTSGNITAQNISSDGITIIGHNNQTTVIHHPIYRSAEARQNWHNRCRMIEQVQDFWITGVLEKSIYQEVLMTLGLHADPQAISSQTIHYKGLELSRTEEREPYALPPGTTIAHMFDEAHQRLLILGAPGGGKTTLLLDLARTLLARAQQDETHPMPVVFNLSSWAQQRQPLDQWLVQELREQYGAGKRLAQQWVQEQAILPLLDGLDEVAAPHRAACVAAINAYCSEHSPEGIVVCSRLAEFRQVDTPLALDAAVVLQPLDDAQMAAFFARAGASLANVQTMLHEHTELQRLARVPLMLHIIALAYGDKHGQLQPPRTPRCQEHQEHQELVDVSPVSDGDTSATDDTPSHDIRTRLFEHYVQRMFERPGRTDTQHATQAQTIRWLAWLAGRMQMHEETVFYLDRLSSSSLPPLLRTIYALLIGIGIGLFSLLWFLIAFAVLSIDTPLIQGGLLLVGVVGSFVIGMVFGLDAWREHPIHTVDSLHWSVHTMLAMERSSKIFWLIMGTLLGLMCMLVGVLVTLATNLFAGLLVVVMMGLALGLPLIVLLSLSQGKHIDEPSYPNERIWLSLRTFARVLLIASIIFPFAVGVPIMALFVLLPLLVDMNTLHISSNTIGHAVFHLLTKVWVLGMTLGMLVGLFYGGGAVVQHALLRLFLAAGKIIPLRFVSFLDYATERIFLRRVGGSYIFVHRMLLEYFAGLANERNT